MKLDTKLAALTLAALACIGGGLYWQLSGDPSRERSFLGFTVSKGDDDSSRQRDQKRGRSAQRIASGKVGAQHEKPNLLLFDEGELAELTDLARKFLASLQAGLDAEDFEQIKAIVAMVQDSPKGVLSRHSEGMPVVMRRRIVEALGWFGAKGMPEMVDFLGDVEPEVVEAAMAQFELALEDISLGDRARAEIVVMASKALHDSDALDRIFMEISNMRNSVAAQTLVDICSGGTDEARALMPDTIEFVTGEDNIRTVEDLERWLDANPDGPDDEDLYGPMDVEFILSYRKLRPFKNECGLLF